MARIYLGHEEDRNPRRLGRRDTRGSTGVPDHFTPCSSGAELVTSNHMVAGANPAGEISQVSKK